MIATTTRSSMRVKARSLGFDGEMETCEVIAALLSLSGMYLRGAVGLSGDTQIDQAILCCEELEATVV